MDSKHYQIIGKLKSYEYGENKIHLVLQIEKTIEIPKNAFSKKELDDCLFDKIGIINIDGNFKLKKYKGPIDRFKEEECTNCGKRESCEKDDKNIVYCLIGKLNKLSR